MIKGSLSYLSSLVTGFDRRIWLLSSGRFFSAIGSGFTSYYAPIFFVNVVKLSSTSVGIGIGLSSLAGFVGRFLGGTLSDLPSFGRVRTLLLAAVLMAVGSFILAASTDFNLFLLGNSLMGMGIGLYWPAAESLIADIMPVDRLSDAFALTRLADYVGMGIGVVCGGLLISISHAYRTLFIVDGCSYVILLLFVLAGIRETLKSREGERTNILKNWATALKDKHLLFFAVLNLLCTSNIIQVTTTLPLFLSNFIPHGTTTGLPSIVICIMFASYIATMAVSQLPTARYLAAVGRARVLIFADILWMTAYLLIWCAAIAPAWNVVFVFAGLFVFAIANSVYGPAAPALVVELAPKESRAIYLSINSLCWALAACIAPPVGMSILGYNQECARNLWLGLALLNLLAAAATTRLDRLIISRVRSHS